MVKCTTFQKKKQGIEYNICRLHNFKNYTGSKAGLDKHAIHVPRETSADNFPDAFVYEKIFTNNSNGCYVSKVTKIMSAFQMTMTYHLQSWHNLICHFFLINCIPKIIVHCTSKGFSRLEISLLFCASNPLHFFIMNIFFYLRARTWSLPATVSFRRFSNSLTTSL